MSSKIIAFATYPLSKPFRMRLEEEIGTTFDVHILADLRRRRPVELLRTLRAFRADRLIFPFEDVESMAVLPVLLVLGSATSARSLESISPTLQRRRYNRLESVRASAALIAGTADGAVSVAAAARRSRRLNAAAPIPFGPVSRGPVLYLNTNFWFGVKAGGSVGHIAGVVNAFHASGWPVTYVSINDSSMIDSDIHTERLLPPRIYGFPAEANHYRFERQAMRVALDAGRSGNPAIVYQRLSLGNTVGVRVSRALRIPLVLEYNGSNVWVSKHWGRKLKFPRLALAAEDACLRHAHRVMTVSQVSADELVERGVPKERVVWYPNCVDDRIFDPARFSQTARISLRRRLGVEDDAILATFVGTFGPWHGAEVLAEAIDTLVSQDEAWLKRRRLRFAFVGDGARLGAVRTILSRHGADRYAVVTGLVPQTDAPAYLAASDILVSPHVPNADGSRFFGSPTKLFEYMAMEKPIIASDIDQVGDVLRPALRVQALPADDGAPSDVRGLLVEPGSVRDIVVALKFLAESPTWRLALGKAARRVVLQRYLWRHHIDHLTASLS